MTSTSVNKMNRVLFIVLPLIILASLSLWYLRNFYRVEFAQMTRVEPVHNVYDLTDIDFSTGFARLQGDLEYIPGILTPEEFARREDEAALGPYWDLPAATTRIIIRLPDNGIYTITRSSVDYAQRAYFNGELRSQAGVPAENAEDFQPGYTWMEVETKPENGVIELVQQGANFVHREGGGQSNLYLGRPEIIKRFIALTTFTEAIKVGLFAALFFVHLILFVVQPGYRPNLYFSLLCLSWAVREGLTGSKVFYALFPALPWQLAYRLEHLALPAAFILLVLLAQRTFPGIVQKWFVLASAVVAASFAAVCLAADTLLLTWVQLYYNGVYAAAVFYLSARFLMKLPKMARDKTLETGQIISLAGFLLFLYAGVNDQLYHMDIAPLDFAVTDAAMMIFSFFQMTAMFYGTMRESALAQERERRAESENEMLMEMNRLKSAFYTDMSHEMKTPLTVIAVNAQFAAQNIRTGAVDEETVTDLTAISAEAKRLAQMVTSLVGLGRMQGGGGGGLLNLSSLLNETARIYQSLFSRKGNMLITESPDNLPPIEGSADQLIQVLINLLSNANRHTAGGTVFVRAELLGSQIQVSVADNGEGISPELLPHVFERFCHGENGGSGLGLPICKTIIEEHGGRINIESEKGSGTRVWFTLPVKEETHDEGNMDDSAGRGR